MNNFLAQIIKANKEIEEKLEEERREKEKQNAEDMVAKMHEESNDLTSDNSGNLKTNEVAQMKLGISENTTNSFMGDTNTPSSLCKTNIDDENFSDDIEKQLEAIKIKTPNQGTQNFNTDDARCRTNAILCRDDTDKKGNERMTRLKTTQIANGTYLYKLGMDNQYKSYVNQYTTNIIALNKPQRNEERDKKRHLSHKFSLTTASEFKWSGAMTGTKSLLLVTLRQTILQLEQSIQSPFMHPNWQLVRKSWLTIVGACQHPKDFAKALIVLHVCMKPVIFANVWHEQLGHIKLTRVTAGDREDRKKIEKREKKERDEEEERNKMIITGYVKYTMGFRHQLWKQKGEEYRIHGRWGWLWLSTTRIHKIVNSKELGLMGGPHKVMVQVRDHVGLKILALDRNMYNFLMRKFQTEHCKDNIKMECDGEGDCSRINKNNDSK